MRRLGLFLAVFTLCFGVYTQQIDVKTVTVGKDNHYIVEAGRFRNENSALQYKLKLSSLLKQNISIEKIADSKDFLVRIGPLADRESALRIQKMLEDTAPAAPATKLDDSANSRPAVQSNKAEPTASNTTQAELSNDNEVTSLEGTAPQGRIWNLRNADIRAVIAEVSRVTGKNFLIDPRVQGKISIVSSSPLNDKALYSVFLSMLQVSGYAAIPSGSVIKIIPNIDAKTVTADSLRAPNDRPRGDDMLVSVIPVHYVPAEQLVPVLRPLMPQWSSVSAYSPSNMLILSGRASNIKQMSRIIHQVDSSSANGIDVVRLQHALAMDVVATLKDVIKVQPGSGTRQQATLAADDRSNAILVSGNRTERLRIRLLIARLDQQSRYGSDSNTQVVYLNYLRAEDLVPILAGIAQANFSGTVGTTIGTITRPEIDSTNPASNFAAGSSSGSGGTQNFAQIGASQSATPNASGPTQASSTQNEGSTKPTVQIIAEPNTNSIILNAPISVIRTLKSVVHQLDIKPAQLLIEALVAEVDESVLSDLGIEWGSNRQTGDVTKFTPGFAIINSKTALTDFQAQLYALVRNRKANVLSTPSVVVLDNRQAKILVGRQLSVATTTYPNNAGGTTTGSPYVTFDRINVALHLYVRPQITRDQGIHLQIDQGNDTIDPSSALDANNPIFKISSIVTAVHIKSGDVVVLGGLIQDSLANDDNGLPILGDIPGIGRLFQRNKRSREKRVLMVFIKPVILNTEKDELHYTGEKYRDLREHQLEWLRTQEQFHEKDKQVILPPLKSGDLPVPFANPAPRKETIVRPIR